MGRGHGGSRGGGPGGSASIRRNDTEYGFTSAMSKAVLGREGEIRFDKVENAAVFDQQGNVIFTAKGTATGVSLSGANIENAVITHNHPWGTYKGTKAPGTSFSADDVYEAINGNASEIRVVTKNYTYSLKRPKRGWAKPGQSLQEAARKARWYYTNKWYSLESSNQKYVNTYKGNWKVARDRATMLQSHMSTKAMAKELGFTYTWKKG